MKQRLEIPLEPDDVQAVLKGFIDGLTPKFVGLKGFRGVRALYLNDVAVEGVELVFELRGRRSFPLLPNARRGELFIVKISADGIRIRRETGAEQWFVNVSPDAELVWELGAKDGLMTDEQRKEEFVFQTPHERGKRR